MTSNWRKKVACRAMYCDRRQRREILVILRRKTDHGLQPVDGNGIRGTVPLDHKEVVAAGENQKRAIIGTLQGLAYGVMPDEYRLSRRER